MVALGTYGFDLNCFTGRLRWSDNRLSREVEWNSKNVCVLDVEFSLVGAILIDFVGLPAKGSSDHLLAEKLCSERTDTQYVRYRPGVPALREHRNRDNATDGFAKPPRRTDRIHYFS